MFFILRLFFFPNYLNEAAGEGEAPKRERKVKAAVKKERTKKEDDEALNANVADKFAKDEE